MIAGPTTANNENAPSSTIPFDNCDEPAMPSKYDTVTTNMKIPNGRFSKKGFGYFTFEYQ